MKPNRLVTIAAVASGAVLAACSDSLPLSGPDTFGYAVRHNMEAQIVNPNPQPEAGPIPMNGSRAALAMQRYQADKVKQPRPLRTTEISIFSGGGGNTGGQ